MILGPTASNAVMALGRRHGQSQPCNRTRSTLSNTGGKMKTKAAPLPVTTHEPEITGPVRLCTKKGRLRRSSVGWSRHPLHTSNIRGHWLRKKKWNYWAVASDRYLFSATVGNLDYLGIVFVYFLDFETKRFIEKTVTTPLGVGCAMP